MVILSAGGFDETNARGAAKAEIGRKQEKPGDCPAEEGAAQTGGGKGLCLGLVHALGGLFLLRLAKNFGLLGKGLISLVYHYFRELGLVIGLSSPRRDPLLSIPPLPGRIFF